MLSQIANTLGTGVDAEPYVRGVQNTFRPTITDPNSVEQQRGLMEWQNKMGRTQEAGVTMANMRDMQDKQKEAAAKREGQARSAALNELSKAVISGDSEAIAAAKDAVYKVGEAQGVDMGPSMEGRMQAARAQKNQLFEENERARQAQERADDAKKEGALGQLSAAMNQAQTVEQADALLAKAPPEVAEQAAVLHNRATTRIDKAQTRAEKERDMSAPVATVSAEIPESLPEEVKQAYKTRIEALNKQIEKANENPSLIPNVERQRLQKERSGLESGLYSLQDSIAVKEYSADLATEREYRSKRAAIIGKTLSSTAVKEAMKVDGLFNDISYEKAEEKLKQKLLADLDAEYGRAEFPGAPPVGTIEEGMKYIGGDPKLPESWEEV